MNLHQNRRSIPSARQISRLRCMTLLEVLIAVVLLAALTAIVAPMVFDRLDERAFEAAADTTSEQLMMARAHAQATGEAVEVTYSPTTGEVQARLYAPWSKEIEVGQVQPGTSPLIDSAGNRGSNAEVTAGDRENRRTTATAGGSDESMESALPIAEGWATRALGRGIRIATHRPKSGAESSADAEWCDPQTGLPVGDHSDDIETLDDLAKGQEVRLAVFMPDGSAMVGENLWLNDERGRCGRISINPWSGLPMFQRLADLTNEALGVAEKSSDDDAAHELPETSSEELFPAATDDGELAPLDERRDD